MTARGFALSVYREFRLISIYSMKDTLNITTQNVTLYCKGTVLARKIN